MRDLHVSIEVSKIFKLQFFNYVECFDRLFLVAFASPGPVNFSLFFSNLLIFFFIFNSNNLLIL